MCMTHSRRTLLQICVLFVISSTAFLYYVATKNEKFSPKFLLHSGSINESYSKVRSNYTQSFRSFHENKIFYENKINRFGTGNAEIKLAVVLCGNRLNQTLTSLKSALVFSSKNLHFILIVDDDNRQNVTKKLLELPDVILQRISFEVHPITFPLGSEGEEWKKLFKLCACQRLFLPSLLHKIDSLLYVDTDVLFVKPIEKLWSHFYSMNSSHIAALSPEHEDFATGWYNRFAKHPYYEPLGVNSGVMLMNLTRMRKFQWETYLSPIMKEYKLNIVWGDQDIINIIFHFHSDKLLILPCEWNFRPDHCMYSNVCKSSATSGISVLHGNRGVFHNSKQPAFKAIYNAIDQHDFENTRENLLENIKVSLKETVNTRCGKYLYYIFSAKSYFST